MLSWLISMERRVREITLEAHLCFWLTKSKSMSRLSCYQSAACVGPLLVNGQPTQACVVTWLGDAWVETVRR